jgi:predicted transcriptional regulator
METFQDLVVSLLDDKDLEIITRLQVLGLPRNAASSVVCLAHMPEASSRDIERCTGLRQPEVSMAMAILKARGWINEHEVKREHGKGRPIKFYALRATLDEILKHLGDEKARETDQAMASIHKLKELAQLRSCNGQ